ncbi:DUF1822 family protein [Leptolyngbyaceae cyanobacterium CCMR0082]|uniref:DUF1822 family protein n=1 Tax=Adonisia turfae CCMR0082 TaxID=2304604 RepID=A0A6M0S8G8_9CYAN|nr:DUF1822 family protein [Adonisia turfae]NEZ64656.1 DUF1822 family protein [Adonisia turfae CCMR0082]
METTIEGTGKFTMSIPPEAHQIAQKFRASQSDIPKGKQVYLNTLAVYSVHKYLKILGIDTDLNVSDSWDPVVQSCLDTGALFIGEQYQLECRPVLPDTDCCYIPRDVWADRQGYVAVQLDASLKQATLLGFLQNVPDTSAEAIPLSDFQRLEDLMDVIQSEISETVAKATQLRQWFDLVAQEGWQMVESLLAPPQPVLNFRNEVVVEEPFGSMIPGEMTRGKLLDFGLPEVSNSLALLVGIAPAEKTSFNIRVKVLPLKSLSQLPTELNLSILDAAEEVVMQAQARETDTLELRFGGEVGDHFNIQLMLGGVSIIEEFVI